VVEPHKICCSRNNGKNTRGADPKNFFLGFGSTNIFYDMDSGKDPRKIL
jgi:hypothetical protein